MNRSWLRVLVVASATAAVLSACGGDSHNDGGTAANGGDGSGLPASATSSSAGFMAYMATLVATAGDSAEPINLGTASIPTDDNGDTVVN